MKSSALHDSMWLETVSHTSEYRSKMEILMLSQRDRSNPEWVSLNYVSPITDKSCYFSSIGLKLGINLKKK